MARQCRAGTRSDSTGRAAEVETPWCGVSLRLPIVAAMPPETVAMLGGLERCIAWTLIDGARQ